MPFHPVACACPTVVTTSKLPSKEHDMPRNETTRSQTSALATVSAALGAAVLMVAAATAACAHAFADFKTALVHYSKTDKESRKEPGVTFVLSNPQKAIDYAYRAVHLTATTTKDSTKDYYGKSVSRAYWNSCSNGGRQGLIEAQRFPDDFDGIVANAPWVDQT